MPQPLLRFTLICWPFLVLTLCGQPVSSQNLAPAEELKTDTLNTRQLKRAALGLGLTYTAGMAVLSHTWYRQSDRTAFHFFNDNRQWQQLDKAGHFWGAFHGSRLGVDALQAAGLPRAKALVYGGALGFALLSPVELLDGYASAYGASAGDLAANALGSLALVAQQLAWNEVRLLPKYSFHRTGYAPLRPSVLGQGLHEEMLKDYNGQTYWLAADMSTLIPETSRYPRWLGLALGYGASGMIYGEAKANRSAGYPAYRQYYLALDLNLRAIPTRNKLLRQVFWLLNTVHLPAPAVEYNRQQGLNFYPLYF